MNSKAFIVLLAFVMMFSILANGSLGSTDLTPDTPPAAGVQPASGLQLQPMVGGVSTNLCASPYRVQAGDTLSGIATRCGLVLADLVAANPSISDPNLIRVGQDLLLPAPRQQQATQAQQEQPTQPAQPTQAVQAEPVIQAVATATPAPIAAPDQIVPPGTSLIIEIENMPPNILVQIAIGPTGATYIVIGEGMTDADGILKTDIIVPTGALPGESWTVTAVTTSDPIQEYPSKPILIGR